MKPFHQKHKPIDWADYAQTYDWLADNNPAYQDIIDHCLKAIDQWRLPSNSVIYDIGAGTGNFSTAIAKAHPNFTICHIDNNSAMNAIAENKQSNRNIHNVHIIEKSTEDMTLPANSIDGIICVHSLYCMSNPKDMISNIFKWLKPGGFCYICDIGQIIKTSEWSKFLFYESCKKNGFLKTLALMMQAKQSLRSNKSIAAHQKSGLYWTHTLTDFTSEFLAAGFDIKKSFRCYRGYSNTVICQKNK